MSEKKKRNPRGKRGGKKTTNNNYGTKGGRIGPSRPPGRKAPAGKRGFNAVRFGQRIGKIFSPAIGRAGAEAGRLFRQLTGFGDYKVNSNSLMSMSDRLPTFRNNVSGTRVLHREYLFDVITSSTPGAFKLQTVPIQPALITSFPWLAASAEQYQEYTINGCVYEFKSNSYDALASTNTASGTVIMSTDYNVLDPPYTNKFQMEQSQFTCSSKPSRDLLHPIECAKIETPTSVLYTRASLGGSGDQRLYDWGNFQLATVGMQGASVNVGEVWVTYDITLFKPKLGAAVDVADHYVLVAGDLEDTATTRFGTVQHPPPKTPSSDMGTYLSSSDGVGLDTINWPPGYTGNVLVLYTYISNNTISPGPAPVFLPVCGGGAALKVMDGGGMLGALMSYTQNVSGNQMQFQTDQGTVLGVFITITNGGFMFLTGGTISGTGNVADLIIVALPSGFS